MNETTIGLTLTGLFVTVLGIMVTCSVDRWLRKYAAAVTGAFVVFLVWIGYVHQGQAPAAEGQSMHQGSPAHAGLDERSTHGKPRRGASTPHPTPQA